MLNNRRWYTLPSFNLRPLYERLYQIGERVMLKVYIVLNGVDSRHMNNVKSFNLLRESRIYLNSIKLSYLNKPSAYRLERHVFKNNFSTDGSIKILEQKIV